MPQISLFLLGAPRLLRDGQSVDTDTRKAVALLAYLALTDQSHSRDTLAVLFYPETDEAHARGALRRTLSTLNKALGSGCLRAGREQIGLSETSNLWVDVRQFQQLLAEVDRHTHSRIEECSECLARLERCAILYRGDLMAGFSLRNSPGFDEWQFFQTEGLRRQFAFALERLAHASRLRGEMDKAIEYARRWLTLDPLVEDAHRALMRAYAQAGQRSAALRQYHECERLLRSELDVDPLEETRRLYQEIHDNHFTPESLSPASLPVVEPVHPKANQRHPADAHPNIMDTEPRPQRLQLIGRERELEIFREQYDYPGRTGVLLVLEGEPGIGKTRLADEMLNYAAQQGAVTLSTRCYPGEDSLAYTPFIEIIRATLQTLEDSELRQIPGAWLAEAGRLLPELYKRFPDLKLPTALNDPGALNNFYDGLRQILNQAASSLPGLVIFLDDLQWADLATLDLLAYILLRLQTSPLFIVAAWRDEALPAQKRLRALLADAQRGGFAAHIRLERLNPVEASELTRQLMEALPSVDERFNTKLAERLYQESEGLPFFLVEYLEALYHEAAERGRPSQINTGLEWPLPENARDLLHLRITDLDELARQILATAAVIGRSFDFETLAAAAGRSEAETISGLEILMAHGLIVEGHGCGSKTEIRYDFSHDKLRTQVYEETSLVRRQLLHRRVAEFLVEQLHYSSQPEHLAGQIARHFRLAGQKATAAGYYQQAGDASRRLFANRLAVEHYEQALECGHPDVPILYEALGELHTLLGEYGPAVDAYRQAMAAGKAADIPRISHKMGATYQRSGEWQQAIARYRFALEAHSPPSNALAARILADWSLAALQTNEIGTSELLANQALERAEAAADPPAVAQAYNLLGILARRAGRSDEARKNLERSLEIAGEIGDAGVQAAALNNLSLLLEDLGEFRLAVDYTQKALVLSERIGDRHRAAALHNNLADLLHKTGEGEQAMVHLKQAVAIFAQIEAVAEPSITGSEDRFQPEIWKLIEW